jgi:hypothetical protein
MKLRQTLLRSAMVGMSILLLATFMACAPRVNVDPFYDAAIQNYEAAQQLELTAVDLSAEARIAQFTVLLEELEQLTITQLSSLVRAGWDSGAVDFRATVRDESWHALAGLPMGTDIPADLLFVPRALLEHHLTKTVIEYTPENGTQSITVTGFEILFNPRVAERLPGLADESRTQFVAEAQTWHLEFEQQVLPRMPVVEELRSTRQALLDSVANERLYRRQHTEAVYAALIRTTEAARAYAGALADSEQAIGLANRILSLANQMPGLASTVLPDPPNVPVP